MEGVEDRRSRSQVSKMGKGDGAPPGDRLRNNTREFYFTLLGDYVFIYSLHFPLSVLKASVLLALLFLREGD